MILPAPEPGLVSPYAYLWHHEHRRGSEEGRKVRPAVIVLTTKATVGSSPVVTVVPVTHARPGATDNAVELPTRVKQALGLDDQRSWVMVDEVNQFTWPGFDLGSTPGTRDRFQFGFLPPRLFAEVLARLVRLIDARAVRAVPRD